MVKNLKKLMEDLKVHKYVVIIEFANEDQYFNTVHYLNEEFKLFNPKRELMLNQFHNYICYVVFKNDSNSEKIDIRAKNEIRWSVAQEDEHVHIKLN